MAIDLRARDLDRAMAVSALDTAYSDGQLSFDEHRARADRAEKSTTLGQLRQLVGDLQAEVPLPDAPTPRRSRRPLMICSIIAVVVIAVAALLLTAGKSDESPPTPTPASIPIASDIAPIVAPSFVLDTAEGLQQLIAGYRTRFGDTTVYRFDLYPSDGYGIVSQPVLDGRMRRIDVRGGFAPSADTGLPGANDRPFDLGLVDTAALASNMAGAANAVARADASVNYVSIQSDRNIPVIAINVADQDGRGGRIETDLAGTVLATATY